MIFHRPCSADGQCACGIERPGEVFAVALAAAVAGGDDVRREDLCRQGGQHAQDECESDESAENPGLLFHGKSLFLLISLANTT